MISGSHIPDRCTWRLSFVLLMCLLCSLAACTPPRGETDVALTPVSEGPSLSPESSPTPLPNEVNETQPPSEATTEAAGDTTEGPVSSPQPTSPVSKPVSPVTSRPSVVSVQVTRAGWDPVLGGIVAVGVIPNILEGGGTCSVSATREGTTVSETVAGEPDAASTVCRETRIGAERLAPGEWKVVIQYISPTSTGESEEVVVVVP